MKDILVVEDGPQENERLRKLFSEAGYAVDTCRSVREAEEHLEKFEYRLAILDIGLSDRSGSYLFSVIKRRGKGTYVIIFTGNPSVHLKQRFLSEGALDYIVKGSPQALNENFMEVVKGIIGEPGKTKPDGEKLEEFLEKYVPETSRQLFLDMDNSFPECSKCGSRQYVVTFSQKTQMPPELSGLVVCAGCGEPMDPEISD